jgi:hypothetical protein
MIRVYKRKCQKAKGQICKNYLETIDRKKQKQNTFFFFELFYYYY